MAFQTGATITIRGKGAVRSWDKRGRDGKPFPGADEPSHVYITSKDPETVKNAVDKIRNFIKEAQDAELTEGQKRTRKGHDAVVSLSAGDDMIFFSKSLNFGP